MDLFEKKLFHWNGMECIGMEWIGLDWNGMEWIHVRGSVVFFRDLFVIN